MLILSSVEEGTVVQRIGLMEDGSTMCRHTNSFIDFHADLTKFTSMTLVSSSFLFLPSLGPNKKGGQDEGPDPASDEKEFKPSWFKPSISMKRFASDHELFSSGGVIRMKYVVLILLLKN